MKDLLLRAQLVVRTSNLKTARRRLADYVIEMDLHACRTITFLHSTNNRCLCSFSKLANDISANH